MNTKQIENGKDEKDNQREDVKTKTKIAASSTNPFDLAKLKLSQDFETAGGGVRRKITTVPVRKPNKHSFFRVIADEKFKLTTAVLEFKEDGSEMYLISPGLRDELMEDLHIVQIVTTIDRQNNVVLWPVKLPSSEGRSNTWNDSAMAAAQHAEKQWIRMVPNMRLGAYDVFVAAKDYPEPQIPDTDFQQLIQLAFKDRFIDSMDHPILKKLRGEE